MRRLERAVPRIAGIPVNKKTVKDLGTAMKDILARRFVDSEERERRQSICNGCEHWKKRFNRCNMCGCQMRVKTSLSSSQCPIKKW